MAVWKPTAADRDTAGRIITEPRKLADLLPPVEVEPEQDDAKAPQQPLSTRQLAVLCVGLLLLVAALVALLVQPQSTPAATPATLPTAGVVASAPALPTTHPTIAPALLGLRQSAVAYDAPGGRVLGAIEAGRVYTPTARYGASWVQLEAVGSGLVWLPAADPALGEIGMAGLPDLEPPPTPIPAPVQHAPNYQAAPAEVAPTWMPPPLPTMAPVPTRQPCTNCKPKEDGLHRRPILDDPSAATNGAGGIVPARIAHSIDMARRAVLP